MYSWAWTCPNCLYGWDGRCGAANDVPVCPICGPDALRRLVREAFWFFGQRGFWRSLFGRWGLRREEQEWMRKVEKLFNDRNWLL